MKREITIRKTIVAPAAAIYEIIANYRSGHPRILPARFFRDFKVEEGGIGEGTRITFAMSALGTTRSFEVVVLEPEPGRLLVETDLRSGVLTSFFLEPLGLGGTAVTISTRVPVQRGPIGHLKWTITRRYLLAVFEEELRLLAALVEGVGEDSPALEPELAS